MRRFGDLKEVSRGAVYKIFGRGPDAFNVDNAHLLGAQPPQIKQHAFRSAENVENPHVVIKLAKPAHVQALQIVNRKTKDQALLSRAKGLTVCTSSDNKNWKQQWTAESVKPIWTIELREGARIQYVKIGLAGRGTLHLNQVVMYGQQ